VPVARPIKGEGTEVDFQIVALRRRQNELMTSDVATSHHFARAVVQLGDKRPVVARSAIFNAQGLKIIDKGVAIDARLYERLTQHQLRSPLEECVDSEPGVSGHVLRAEASALCKEDRFCASMMAQLRDPASLFDELQLLPLPRPVAFQLTVMREVRQDLWQSSLRRMLCAAWLAVSLGGARYDTRMLAAGGMLHDIGMLHLDPVLGQPGVQLQREQRRQLYTHPLISVMQMERHHVYPKELLQAVLEHHEALDGSGYPRHLTTEQSPWGRLLALTELISSFTASRRSAPALRLSVALRMNAHRFDAEALGIVTAWLRPLREALPDCEGAAEPVAELRRTEELLQGWRAACAPALEGAAGPARAHAAQRVAELCDKQRKVIAACGADAEQLALLGNELDDQGVRGELALVAREAAWQLRNVARQARRGWRREPAEAFPAAVQSWLDEVDAHCAAALGS